MPDDWLEPLSAAIKNATGHSAVRDGRPLRHRCGPFNERGTTCVVFGPGDIAQAHTKDEWIELDQVQHGG